MAYTNYRRSYKPRRRVSRRYLKKKKLMARIKKDINKCNFPTKIKFVGLPEKKVMFLQETINLEKMSTGIMEGTGTNIKEKKYSGPVSIILNPMNCDTTTLFKTIAVSGNDVECPNFDKFTILGVYIKMTPNANNYAPGQSLRPISCFYALNTPSYDTSITTSTTKFDYATRGLKQKFSFNCNENFTFFLNRPQTMDLDSPVIYKAGTWWSLGELKESSRKLPAETIQSRRREEIEEDYEEEEDVESTGIQGNKVEMNCGRLFFWSENSEDSVSIPYTMTISYKIALKG